MKLQLPHQITRSEKQDLKEQLNHIQIRWNQLKVHLESSTMTADRKKWSLEQSKYLYDKQLAREQIIEGKVNRMFGVLSLSITLVGFLFIQLPLHNVHLKGRYGLCLDILELLCGVGFFFNLLGALYMLFQSTKLYKYMGPDEQYLTVPEDDDAVLQLTKDFVYSYLTNQYTDSFKGALVIHTLRYFGWSLVWFVVTVILEFILKGLSV